MPLHMTKIAHGCASVADLREWLESHAEVALMTTRYLPTRHAEMAGGSLFWIHSHAIIGRSPLLGFAPKEDGRQWIRLEPRLILVHPVPKRAHQGWRYLTDENAPEDFASTDSSEVMPGRLVSELAKLGLV
ncbi:MAG: DUF1489 domain-containing protein [Novosphingobium sp.]